MCVCGGGGCWHGFSQNIPFFCSRMVVFSGAFGLRITAYGERRSHVASFVFTPLSLSPSLLVRTAAINCLFFPLLLLLFLASVNSNESSEGRLLRRFLTMAQARKSPPLSASSSFSSPPPPAKSVRVASFAAATAASVVCSLSSMGRGDGGNASTGASTDADPKANANAKPDANALKANKIGSGKPSDKAVVGVASAGATVGVSNRATGQEEWDGDGAVGPQVVRAFINYFSKEVGSAKVNFFFFFFSGVPCHATPSLAYMYLPRTCVMETITIEGAIQATILRLFVQLVGSRR